MNETSCATLEELLESDVSLSDLRRRVERHVDECPVCGESARDVVMVLSELETSRSVYESLNYDKELAFMAGKKTYSLLSTAARVLLKAAAILVVLTFLGALAILMILRDDHSRNGDFGMPSMSPPTPMPTMTMSFTRPSMPSRPNLSLALSPSRPELTFNQRGR